jgi:spermidine synthase
VELQNFLSSLYFTLKEVFPEVKIVPGGNNVFLASAKPLAIDADHLSRRIRELHLDNTFVSPELLFSRLSPLRIHMLKEKVAQGNRRVNLDFIPISYFYNSVLWSTQFRGLEEKIFSFLSHLSSFWLLDFPLFLFVLFLILLWLARKKTSLYLIPLAVMGFTTIVFEIIVIISFQTLYGYLYQRIPLLLACFMIGLALGALRRKNRKRINLARLLSIQFGFMLIVLIFLLTLNFHPPEILFFFFLLILGFLGGDLFVVSNSLFLQERKNYGLGYGLDLLGSFLGALVASSILIPLIGLPLLLRYLFLLNSFCLVFLAAGLFRR